MFRKLTEPFQALRNPTFGRLYWGQTISLVGDAFTWVGLALLAFQIDSKRSSEILATALTIRVTAFILIAPIAGVIADRWDRKRILYVTHFVRMALVCCLPFVAETWQIYGVVFFLNVFNALFTPTYRAVIPQIIEGQYYREAVGLSTATYQVFGILGPALAGAFASWFGAREIFIIDGISFLIAGLFILSIPGAQLQKGTVVDIKRNRLGVDEAIRGTRLLFSNRIFQFALSIEFVSAIAGANILVNTIGHVKGELLLDDKHYGWVMATFGIGAAVAAFGAGIVDRSKTRAVSLMIGSLVLCMSIVFANHAPYTLLLILWAFAGFGQSLAEMPSETLIGENVEGPDQGKVYGAHFAVSHLWWALAYPLAGYFGTHFPEHDFLYSGLLTAMSAILAASILYPRKSQLLL